MKTLLAAALLAACSTSATPGPDASDAAIPAVTCFMYTDCAGKYADIIVHADDGDLGTIRLDTMTSVEASDHTCAQAKTNGGLCVHTADPAQTCAQVCAGQALWCDGLNGLCSCLLDSGAQFVCTR